MSVEATTASASTPASASAASALASAPIPPIEYPPVSAAAAAAGRISIVGFGSLLSPRSACATFGAGAVTSFRPGVITGWRRIFAHVAPIFIERGIADVRTKEMSSLSVEPCEGAQLRVSVFEIPLSGLPAFFEREMEFRWTQVPVYLPPEDGATAEGDNQFGAASAASSADGPPARAPLRLDPRAINGEALLCTAYTDEEYRTIRLRGSEAAWQHQFGRWGLDRVWRDDLLPCGVYLRHVVLAAENMDRTFFSKQRSSSSSSSSSDLQKGEDNTVTWAVGSDSVRVRVGPMLRSFLDCTFLGDRATTVRAYLRANPGVMLKPPPESLKQRYSG